MGIPWLEGWRFIHFRVSFDRSFGEAGKHTDSRFLLRSANQMPKAVQKSLKTVFQNEGGMSEAAANSFFEKMEAEGRYQEETWN